MSLPDQTFILGLQCQVVGIPPSNKILYEVVRSPSMENKALLASDCRVEGDSRSLPVLDGESTPSVLEQARGSAANQNSPTPSRSSLLGARTEQMFMTYFLRQAFITLLLLYSYFSLILDSILKDFQKETYIYKLI